MSEHRSNRNQNPTVQPRGGPGGPGGPGGGPGGHFMRPKERAKNIRGTVLRLWDYLKRQKWALAAILLLVVVSSGLGLLGPYLMGIAIDDYILQGDIPGLGRIVLLMFGVYLATSAVSWVQVYIMASTAQRTVRDIRNDLFARLQTCLCAFRPAPPELMSRLSTMWRTSATC